MKRARDRPRSAEDAQRTEPNSPTQGKPIRMKRSQITLGHQATAATSRLHADCIVAYPWSSRTVIATHVMNAFGDTAKAIRRRKESSP
jgi:hypothetical protein